MFGSENSRKGPESHRLLDSSIYSYNDLRKAYLERIQMLHPDKQRTTNDCTVVVPNDNRRSANDVNSSVNNRTISKDSSKFMELQSAWNQYEGFAKMMKKVGKGAADRNDGGSSRNNNSNAVDANFTMFGVGCSFADNEQERTVRTQIMDQASRGWFSAGALPDGALFSDGSSDSSSSSASRRHESMSGSSPAGHQIPPSLLDEALFEEHKMIRGNNINLEPTTQTTTRPPWLVSHLAPPSKRRR
jgi:hypothetical protein